MTIYQTNNGTKPRYDNGGTEFGAMHRDLGPGYLMFDIDRMTVRIDEILELKKEEEGFVEYRLYSNKITFVSIIELKKRYTEQSSKALDLTEANSLARAEICNRLSIGQDKRCRLFVVYATDGQQPFDFYEYIEDSFVFVGRLTYSREDRQIKVKEFWSNVLCIEK